MAYPYPKGKEFKVIDKDELFNNANDYDGIQDAVSTFQDAWGAYSVPDKFVIQDYYVYDEGIGHKVEYHYQQPIDETISSNVMLEGIKSLVDGGVLKPL